MEFFFFFRVTALGIFRVIFGGCDRVSVGWKACRREHDEFVELEGWSEGLWL